MKLCRFLTSQRETRVGLLTAENQVLDLSDAGVNNLTFLHEAEGALEQLETLSQQSLARFSPNQIQLLSPVERQEVWAAGVIYLRGKKARMEESNLIATFAVSLIGVDAIKWIWGVNPYPMSDPIGKYLMFWGLSLPIYRIIIVMIAILLFVALHFFFKKTIVGKIVVAALDDKDGVRCLGINVDKYFSIVFVLGSALAALGGVLYAPISSIHPYMGLSVLLLSFAVVIVGGMGNLKGTFVSAFALGMVMALTARYWSQGAETMVFIVMAIVLIFRPIDI